LFGSGSREVAGAVSVLSSDISEPPVRNLKYARSFVWFADRLKLPISRARIS